MSRLANKAALITSGTTGFGFATAQALLAAGARGNSRPKRGVAGCSRKGAGRRGDRSSGRSGLGRRSRQSCRPLKSEFGKLDVLFVNAGIVKPATLADITAEHVAEHLSVNFTGALFTIQRMLPLRNNPGSVISTSTTFTEKGAPGLSVHSARKAAPRSLARTLSAAVLSRRIRVNVVSPGQIETPIFAKLRLPAEALDAMAGQMLRMVPMGRFGKPEEIARRVVSGLR